MQAPSVYSDGELAELRNPQTSFRRYKELVKIGNQRRLQQQLENINTRRGL